MGQAILPMPWPTIDPPPEDLLHRYRRSVVVVDRRDGGSVAMRRPWPPSPYAQLRPAAEMDTEWHTPHGLRAPHSIAKRTHRARVSVAVAWDEAAPPTAEGR